MSTAATTHTTESWSSTLSQGARRVQIVVHTAVQTVFAAYLALLIGGLTAAHVVANIAFLGQNEWLRAEVGICGYKLNHALEKIGRLLLGHPIEDCDEALEGFHPSKWTTEALLPESVYSLPGSDVWWKQAIGARIGTFVCSILWGMKATAEVFLSFFVLLAACICCRKSKLLNQYSCLWLGQGGSAWILFQNGIVGLLAPGSVSNLPVSLQENKPTAKRRFQAIRTGPGEEPSGRLRRIGIGLIRTVWHAYVAVWVAILTGVHILANLLSLGSHGWLRKSATLYPFKFNYVTLQVVLASLGENPEPYSAIVESYLPDQWTHQEKVTRSVSEAYLNGSWWKRHIVARMTALSYGIWKGLSTIAEVILGVFAWLAALLVFGQSKVLNGRASEWLPRSGTVLIRFQVAIVGLMVPANISPCPYFQQSRERGEDSSSCASPRAVR